MLLLVGTYSRPQLSPLQCHFESLNMTYDTETGYNMIAKSLDQICEEQHPLYLAKLALILSEKIGNIKVLEKSIAIASLDLNGTQDFGDLDDV